MHVDNSNFHTLQKDQKYICIAVDHYREKSLSILQPWKVQLYMDVSERTDIINEAKINEGLDYRGRTKRLLGICCTCFGSFKIADDH